MAPNTIVKLKSRELKKGSLEPQNVITSRKIQWTHWKKSRTSPEESRIFKKRKRKKCGKQERIVRTVWEVQDQIERGTAENWGKLRET